MPVLYFDIGNTRTKIALSAEVEHFSVYSLPTTEQTTSDQIGLMLLEILRHNNISPSAIIACIGASVVPRMASLVCAATKRYLDTPVQFVPDDIPLPLHNNYARPYEVGADRLAVAYAARCLFPEAAAVISVDFGTATTFDCVQGDTYLGGLICPGVESSIQALASRTAKLPHISLDVTSSMPEPGTSTVTSLNHGFIFGFAAMTKGLCQQLSLSMQGPIAIVGTGGFASVIAKVSNCFDAVCPDLLLEGLRLLFHNHTGRELPPLRPTKEMP